MRRSSDFADNDFPAPQPDTIRQLIEASNDGFWDWNIETGAVYFSDRWAGMLGYRRDEIEPHVRSWERLVHPDDLPRVTQVLQAHLDGKTPLYETEHRLRAKNGEWRWILDRGRVVARAADGRPLRAAGAHIDITDRKRFEAAEASAKAELERVNAALQASEEAFRDTFDLAAVGIAHVGLDGRWLRVNRALCTFLGYSEPALRQRTFAELTHPDDLDADLAQARRLEAGEIESYTLEKRYVRADGEIVWGSLTGSVKRAADGTPVHFIAIIEDITARKSVEDRLRAALAARDEFVSVASHEMRTPITSMVLQVQLIRRLLDKNESGGVPRERLERLISLSQTQLDRLTRLVEDMLDVSRMRTGKLEIRPEQVDLAQLVSDALERLAPQLAKHENTLTTALEPGIVGRWDPLRLEQVVTNLVANAARYAPKTHVHIATARQGDQARLVVRDEGPGIPVEWQSRIFERFERGTGDSGGRGLGLGLYIVHEIVRSHGGVVMLRSAPGAGTTFEIDLPLAGPPENP